MIANNVLFQVGEHGVEIAGPIGTIEAKSLCPEQSREDIIAVICHPHPLHGGTMKNKVVTTVARSVRDLGICSLRFNFRGVGKTEGEYDEGRGEAEDLLAILSWIHERAPQIKIIVVGFSFGAYVSYRVASQTNLNALILLAPPVHHYDFDTLAPPNCNCLVIQGEDDEIVPPEAVYAWLRKQPVTTKLIRLAQTGHFFHGKLVTLKEKLHEYMTQYC